MQKVRGACLIFALFSLCTLTVNIQTAPAEGQAPVFSRDYAKLLVMDTKYTLTAPVRWGREGWRDFYLYTAGIGTILLLDDEIYNMIQHNRTKAIDDTAIAVEYFGSAPSFGIMGAFYLGGAFLDNYKAKRVAMDAFAASLISAGMITTTLKVVAGRSRPYEDGGTYRFQPFGGDRSFPSGHTTQAFSLASVIAEHYDEWWIDAISYGIAAGVGFARIEQEAHLPSDVVAGAVIGTIVGKTLVRYNRGFYRGITLTPSWYGSDTGINLRITF